MKYLKVWTDLRYNLKPFSDAEKGRLFDAMMEYAECGTEPDLRGNERFIWETVKAEIDRQREAYKKKCEVNRINGASRTQSHPVATNGPEPLQEHKTNKTEDKEKREKNIGRFTPPTVDEVRAYCKERRNTVNPERFVAWYEANGWKVGKNPMKNWQAAVRTWEDGKAYSGGEVKKSKYDGVENLSKEEEDFRMRYADVIVNGSPLGRMVGGTRNDHTD